MTNLSLKQKIMALVAVVGAILIVVFMKGFYGKSPVVSLQSSDKKEEQVNDTEIRMVSITPAQIKDNSDTIITPTQVIEITFNQPLENRGELKYIIDPPKPDLEVKLSDDRKTAKFIPTKPYSLGQGYTLYIKGESKFDGKRKLDKEYVFHYKTISYNGV